MPIRIHYQTITSYRELPSKYRVLESEDSLIKSAEPHVHRLDANAELDDPSTANYALGQDLLAFILGRQAKEHAATASTLSKLILNRRALTKRQIDDIQWRLDEMMEKRPIQRLPEGKISEAEKMIIDLERQKRQAEVKEWSDLLELRRAMVDERRAYETAQARWRYLGGGGGGGSTYGAG